MNVEIGQVRRRPGFCKFIVAEKVFTSQSKDNIWGWFILLEDADRIFVSTEWLEQTEVL